MRFLSRDRFSWPTGAWRNPVAVLVSILLSGMTLSAVLWGLSTRASVAAPMVAPIASALPASIWTLTGDVSAIEPPSLRRLTYDGRSLPWTWTSDGQHLLIQRPGHIVDRQQLSQL